MNRYESVSKFFATALVACIVCSISRARYLDLKEKNPAQNFSQFVPAPESLKLLAGGFDQVLADLYWLAFVQYVGDVSQRTLDHYAEAYKYADLISSLDASLISVYYFSAFTIGSEQHKPDLAATLIDRGISANQNNWYLPFIAGINQYLYAHDEVRAAKYYRAAAKFPDAPTWLTRQADILEAKIPSKIKEINVWDSIYNTALNATVKERARKNLIALWSQVYQTSPPGEIKMRALTQLGKLGEGENVTDTATINR